MKVVALAGGVGGAKLADGLARVLPPDDLTVIVNTGDDFTHFGLKICPDLDTVCYTLVSVANPETGWGRVSDSFHVMDELEKIGAPAWFKLGDKDLAWNLERTRLLQQGQKLSEVTAHFLKLKGCKIRVLPMSDDPCPTVVEIEGGCRLSFQEYFVREHFNPRVIKFDFSQTKDARPAPGVLEAIDGSDLVVICPSNPFVSIDPILKVPGIEDAIRSKPCLAVSPIIAGNALKGPAAKMYSDFGIEPSATAVAEHLTGLIKGFIFDQRDLKLMSDMKQCGIILKVTDTIINKPADRVRLAEETIQFGKQLLIG